MLAVSVASRADCNELQTQLSDNNPGYRVGTVTLQDGKPIAGKASTTGFLTAPGSRLWAKVSQL
jgi:hypothetical protein